MDINPMILEHRYLYAWLKKTHTVVDLGSGDGTFTQRLVRYCKQIIAVDRRLPPDRSPDIDWVQADVLEWVQELDPSSQFDLGYVRLLLHFLPKEASVPMLQKLGMHIRPGGRLYVLTWSDQPDNDFPSGWKRNDMLHPWTFFSPEEVQTIFPDWNSIYAQRIVRQENGRYTGKRHTFANSFVVLERPPN